jgi:hypothetical protein
VDRVLASEAEDRSSSLRGGTTFPYTQYRYHPAPTTRETQIFSNQGSPSVN